MFWSLLLDKTVETGGAFSRPVGSDDQVRNLKVKIQELGERNKKLEGQVQKYETDLYGKSADKYTLIEVKFIK